MDKSVIASAALALGLFATPRANSAEPLLQLKEEQMTIEYAPQRDEAVVILEAESENSLGSVEVCNPSGASILKLRSGGGVSAGGADSMLLQGLELETKESRPGALFKRYPEGTYDIFAWTVDNGLAVGSAELAHDLLPAPVIVFPKDNAIDVATKHLVVEWVNDPNAAGYQVILEQGESDGLKVDLPPGSSSFEVPGGVLESGKRTQLEIGAIGPEGNRTVWEIVFRTL